MKRGYLAESAAGALWGWGSIHPLVPSTNTGDALLCVPAALVPLVGGLLARLEPRYPWSSDADWRAGYQTIVALQEQLFMSLNCVQQLIESNDRIYRLLDASLNGTRYELVGDVISPTVAAVPPASTGAPNALRAHIGRLLALMENATSGMTYAAGTGVDGAPALTDDQTARDLLRRLTKGIDGNTDPAPADNLLMALRGSTEADADRNVIDSTGTTLTNLLDQVETLLTEIRDKLA